MSKIGVKFPDLTKIKDGAMTIVQWGPAGSGPKWYQPHHGLCFEGKCETPSCVAYDQTIIHNWGIGVEFDLIKDGTKLACPICNVEVIPTTCAFNNCDWRFVGFQWHWRGSNKGKQPANGGWYCAGNAYHRFDEAITANWLELKIYTERMGVYTTGGRTG